MSNLQQVIECLEQVGFLAVGIFQVQSAVLLEVKALVFDLAADAAALFGDRGNGVGAEGKIGEPGKGVFFLARSFLQEQGVDFMPAGLVVLVIQVIDLAIELRSAVGQAGFEAVMG